MSRQLRSWVHVPDENGIMKAFGPGDVVPEWAEVQITNPKAWAEDAQAGGDAPAPTPTQAAPATDSGSDGADETDDGRPKKNASRDAWAEYADAHGIAYDEDAGRDDIIAAVEALDD